MSRLRIAAVAALTLVLPVGVAVSPARAAGSIPAAVSLTAPASGTYGTAITLQGRLWRYGTPYGIARSKVWLQRSPHGRGRWSSISSATTASTGNYTFRVTQTGASDYRVYYGGSAAFRAALSPVRYPATTQRMTFESIVTTNAGTGALRATGYVYPLPPNGRPVYLQRWDPGTRAWHTIGGGRTSGGRVTATATRPGSVSSYRLVVPARGSYGAGVSPTRSFAHYVWRGAFARHGVIYTGGGGEFSAPSPDQNPRRDTVNTWTQASNVFWIGVEATGCRQAATASRITNGSSSVQMKIADTVTTLDEETLPPGSVVRLSGVLNPSAPRFFVGVGNSTAYLAAVTTVAALLCAN